MEKYTDQDWIDGIIDIAELPGYLRGVPGQEPYALLITGQLPKAEYKKINKRQVQAFHLALEATVITNLKRFKKNLKSVDPEKAERLYNREIKHTKQRIEAFNKWTKDRYDLGRKSTAWINAATYHTIINRYKNFQKGGEFSIDLSWNPKVDGKFKPAGNDDFKYSVLFKYLEELEKISLKTPGRNKKYPKQAEFIKEYYKEKKDELFNDYSNPHQRAQKIKSELKAEIKRDPGRFTKTEKIIDVRTIKNEVTLK